WKLLLLPHLLLKLLPLLLLTLQLPPLMQLLLPLLLTPLLQLPLLTPLLQLLLKPPSNSLLTQAEALASAQKTAPWCGFFMPENFMGVPLLRG
uniref:hypothetical protein n=1 Tax=Comamonas sp. TaxID=34028 RepID=UPI003A8DD761